MKIYEYEKKDTDNFSLNFEGSFSSYKKNASADIAVFNLSFLSPYITGVKKNDTVSCRLFINKRYTEIKAMSEFPAFSENHQKLNGHKAETDEIKKLFEYLKDKTKLLIFIHGFSTNENKLCNYYKFIEKIVSENTSCLFLNLPFHLGRTPENEFSGRRLINYDDKETLTFFHQSVVDIRKAIDIAEDLLSPTETNICGISLGSMVSVITKAVDKRIKKAVLLLGGGCWEEIHWKGILRFVLRGNCADEGTINRSKCHKYYLNYFEFLDNFKKSEDKTISSDLSEDPLLSMLCSKKCYLCDPLTFAHMINPEEVIMINSNIDHFFTRKSSNLLWKELGKPKIYWLNYPHFSSILNNIRVFGIISEFLYSN